MFARRSFNVSFPALRTCLRELARQERQNPDDVHSHLPPLIIKTTIAREAAKQLSYENNRREQLLCVCLGSLCIYLIAIVQTLPLLLAATTMSKCSVHQYDSSFCGGSRFIVSSSSSHSTSTSYREPARCLYFIAHVESCSKVETLSTAF